MSTRVRLSFLILVLTPSVAFAEAAPVSTPAEATQLNSWIQQGITQTLEGDRDQADATWKDLRAAAPTHPAGWVYQVDTLYWRQIYDEGDPRLDVEITEHAEHAVRLAEARIEKDAKDADAHYYLGQAFIQLGRLDGVRGELLSRREPRREGARPPRAGTRVRSRPSRRSLPARPLLLLRRPGDALVQVASIPVVRPDRERPDGPALHPGDHRGGQPPSA